MRNPGLREDVSKFVVHLSRDCDGSDAEANLISILGDKMIEARNAHCLFKHLLSQHGFSDLLTEAFSTVCFTEAPLTQIHRLVGKVGGKPMRLRPYGLIFEKDTLLERGGNPAIYLNAKGTKLREYLLARFRADFQTIKRFKQLKQKEKVYYRSIIQYYSLVNIVNDRHDFMWEREWRHTGNFSFEYIDIVAIIADDPDIFVENCRDKLPRARFRYVEMIPVISPDWSFEDIVGTMSVKLWNNALASPRTKA